MRPNATPLAADEATAAPSLRPHAAFRPRRSATQCRLTRAHRFHDALMFPRRQALDAAVAAVDVVQHPQAPRLQEGPPPARTPVIGAAVASSVRAAARAARRCTPVPASLTSWPTPTGATALTSNKLPGPPAFSLPFACGGCASRLHALLDRTLGPLAPLVVRAQGGGLVHHVCGPAGSGKSHAALQLLAVRAVLAVVGELRACELTAGAHVPPPHEALVTISPVAAPAVLLAVEPVAASRLEDIIRGVVATCRELALLPPLRSPSLLVGSSSISGSDDDAQVTQAALSRIAIVQVRSVSHLLLSLEQLHRADVRLLANEEGGSQDRRRRDREEEEAEGEHKTMHTHPDCNLCAASVPRDATTNSPQQIIEGLSRVIVLDSFAAAIQLPFSFDGTGTNGGGDSAASDDGDIGASPAWQGRDGASRASATAMAVALTEQLNHADLQEDVDGETNDDVAMPSDQKGRTREHKRALHLFRRAGVVGFALRALAATSGGATSVVVINQIRARPDAAPAQARKSMKQAAEEATTVVAAPPSVSFPTFEENAWGFFDSARVQITQSSATTTTKTATGAAAESRPLHEGHQHGSARMPPTTPLSAKPLLALPYCAAVYNQHTSGVVQPVLPSLHLDGDGSDDRKSCSVMGPTFGAALRPFIHGGCYVLRRVRAAATGAPLQAQARSSTAAVVGVGKSLATPAMPVIPTYSVLPPNLESAASSFDDGLSTALRGGGSTVTAPVRCLHCTYSPWAAGALDAGAAYCLDKHGFSWL